jgi:transcriptional regulator with XRE-family HTH domain
MSQESGDPPMAWRYAGNQVRLWREGAGISRERLADECGYSAEYEKSMEYGRRKPTSRLLEIADQMCNAGGKLLSGTQFLKPEKYPSRSADFMAAEAEAVALHGFEPLLVPGLLQEEKYMRALMAHSYPPMDAEEIEPKVQNRLARQEVMRKRTTTLYSFLVYEAALHTNIGGRDVMRSQLSHMLDMTKLPHVTLQILPMKAGFALALEGPITLLDNPDHTRYAYTDGQKTTALYSDPAQVNALTQTHGMIRMHALSAEESASYIRKVADDL